MRNLMILLWSLFFSIATTSSAAGKDSKWTVERLAIVKGFDVPECLVFDPKRKAVFVSNIFAKETEYWSDDSKGFISLLNANGTMQQLRWLDNTAGQPIHSPKGMCVVENQLYFTDNTRLKAVGIDKPGKFTEINISGAGKLNDLATDGRSILVSDTGTGKIHRFEHNKNVASMHLATIEGVNGVTFHNGQIFAVSWSQHEIFEVFTNSAKPFGLASHFTNLDGIEVLDDGTFIVSDFKGSKISVVSPDKKTVRTLVELDSPADFCIDRARNILYVPQFMKNEAALFLLKRS